MFLIVGIMCFAVTVSMGQEAEIKSASANLEKKDYVAAMDDLSKARKAIGKLITDNLATVLPAKLGEYEMDKVEARNESGMSGVSLNRVYRKPEPQNQQAENMEPNMMGDMIRGGGEQVTVQISTNMLMANEVLSAHSMADEGGSGGPTTQAIRVKGYRAITKSYGGENAGGSSMPGMSMSSTDVAQAVVGAAFVSVEVRGAKEKGLAEKFLNELDLEKLISFVGK